jgi:ribosomal protein S7
MQGIVSDALKYITQKTEQVNTLQKLDERIEEMEEEEATTTTSGIY